MSLAEASKLQTIPNKAGKNFSLIDAGKFADLRQYKLAHPASDKPVRGKLFLKDHLSLTGMQVSFGVLPAGISIPFYHKHKQNEELYIFIGGQGQIQIDGEQLDVKEGTAVRIAPEGERCARNTGSEDLYYIVIQAQQNSMKQDTFDDGIPGDRPVSWD